MNSLKASFGRHETFILRYGWLTKGFQAFEEDNAIFTNDASTIKLGVGKNMVNAIRYWLRAAQLLEDRDQGLVTTALGQLLLGKKGLDPFLEDEATLWLIHWLIATNAELATAWYWFFNCFHKAEFTLQEASDNLADFVRQQFGDKHSEKTVRLEISIITRMYCQGLQTVKTDLEELLDAPLIDLRLITSDNTHFYRSLGDERPSIPIDLIGFALNELFAMQKRNVIPVNQLMYGDNYSVGIGSVFRLTESSLLAKLEHLVQRYPNVFRLDETAGLNQLYQLDSSCSSLSFLQRHYTITE